VLDVRKSIKENLPPRGSGNGFKPQEYVLPLIMILCGGGRTMEDIREVKMDEGLRQLCGSARLPGADAIGQRLRTPEHLKGIKQVNQFQARQVIVRSDKDDFTMDVVATMVETKKQCSVMTYLGHRAFQALLSFIAELDLCVACDYRQGSVPEVIWHYNDLGAAENYNKERKSWFGMNYAPCRSLTANAVYFEISVLAYNLTVAVERPVLGSDWLQRTIASLR
jgi:hypothetical protein